MAIGRGWVKPIHFFSQLVCSDFSAYPLWKSTSFQNLPNWSYSSYSSIRWSLTACWLLSLKSNPQYTLLVSGCFVLEESHTMERPNSGRFGSGYVVSSQNKQLLWESAKHVPCWEVVPFCRGLLLKVSWLYTLIWGSHGHSGMPFQSCYI